MKTGMKTLYDALESMAARYEQDDSENIIHVNLVGKLLRQLLDLYPTSQQTEPTIYLLRRASNNRDFILDGYATNENEIKALVRKFLDENCWLDAEEREGITMTVNMEEETVSINYLDVMEDTFYISKVNHIV